MVAARKVGSAMGVEAVAAAMEHGRSDAVHDRLRLNMEVPVELVRVLPADEAGAIAVDPRAHEGKGATSPSGVGRHLQREDA
jgi:hypothetical protein